MSECKFSTRHYLETINLYRDSGYHIGPVGDYFQFVTRINKKNRAFDKHVILRHDVDLSLDYALDLALLEKDNDIKATYYILLCSDLYSAMSSRGSEIIKQIKQAGHEVGLHVDSRSFRGTIEFEILSRIAQCNITSWCHHLITVTPSLDMPRDAAKIPYKYLSDSAHNWREGCWCNHINKYDKLQILIHPEWTMSSPSGLRTKWEILEDLEEKATQNLAVSFQDFRKLVQEYMQVVRA